MKDLTVQIYDFALHLVGDRERPYSFFDISRRREIFVAKNGAVWLDRRSGNMVYPQVRIDPDTRDVWWRSEVEKDEKRPLLLEFLSVLQDVSKEV